MIENTDDRAAFWMDRDADGSFSRTGLMGDERIIYGNQKNTIFFKKKTIKHEIQVFCSKRTKALRPHRQT